MIFEQCMRKVIKAYQQQTNVLHTNTFCRYDFHRGVDIPVPLYTNVHAVADGTVRIAGSHPLFSDGVVQVRQGQNCLYVVEYYSSDLQWFRLFL